MKIFVYDSDGFLILSGLVILKLTSRITKTISQRDETYPNEFNVSSSF